MTINEAAARLELSPDTLRTQIHNRRLRARKRGRDWWITNGEVERYRAESAGRQGRPLGSKDRVKRVRSATVAHGAPTEVAASAGGSEVV